MSNRLFSFADVVAIRCAAITYTLKPAVFSQVRGFRLVGFFFTSKGVDPQVKVGALDRGPTECPPLSSFRFPFPSLLCP